MTTAERVQQIIAKRGLNVKLFSEQCGYERPQVFYDLIKGKTRNISAAMCNKILTAFPEINKVWLLTGEGSMCEGEADAAPDKAADFADEPVKRVPLLPLSAIAGPLAAYYEGGVTLSDCMMINSPTLYAELALPVSGDSMEPLFADGSIIFIKRINEAAFIPWGHAMVIDTENGIFIKNVMPDDHNESYIWAESINPKYPRMHIPKVSISAFYRVLNVLKTFTTM